MPIKWQPYKVPQQQQRPAPRSPFGMDEFGVEGDDWSPFMPFPRGDEPAVDIYQDKDNLYVEIVLGGVKPDNVEVSIDDNILVIQGKVEEQKETVDKTDKLGEKDYLRKEIKRGSFRRVIKLPIEVKGKKAAAEAENGILKVTIPKDLKSAAKATKIPVQVK